MMNAKEARANVEKYNKEIKEAREKRVDRYLDTTVAREIEENSKNGYETARFTTFIDRKDTELMIKKLEELGYEVDQISDKFIIVEW